MKKIILLICALFIGISCVYIAATAINIPAYIAPPKSTVKHVLTATERGIRLINQNEYKQAIAVLKVESAKQDANATFWLAIAQYRGGQHFDAGDTFLEAAKLGDPWAMSVLGGADGLYYDSPCEYLGWSCDDDWNDKALAGWKALAEQGNPDAIFAYTKMKTEWWNFIPYYRYQRYVERVDQAIQRGGGYDFLTNRLERADSNKYLIIAANQGYGRAINGLYQRKQYTNPDEAIKFAEKAIKLGYAEAAESIYYIYRGEIRRDKKVDKSIYEKAYYYSVLSVELGGGGLSTSALLSNFRRDENGNGVRGKHGEHLYDIYINKTKQAEIEQHAKDVAKGIKINRFLTKNTNKLFNLN